MSEATILQTMASIILQVLEKVKLEVKDYFQKSGFWSHKNLVSMLDFYAERDRVLRKVGLRLAPRSFIILFWKFCGSLK